jgi:hypothetical protein
MIREHRDSREPFPEFFALTEEIADMAADILGYGAQHDKLEEEYKDFGRVAEIRKTAKEKRHDDTAEDHIKPGITKGKPGSAERIADLAEWYSQHPDWVENEESPFDPHPLLG